MAKNVPKRKHTLRNVLLIVAAVPVLFILYLVVTTLLDPVFDQFEKTKFDKLDQQSRELYGQLKAKSGGIETWTYEAKCEPEYSGPWPTGSYYCGTIISTEQPIVSVSQLNSLQEKYYDLIDTSSMLKQSTVLTKLPVNDFGVKFLTSVAEKHYRTSTNDSIFCRYSIEIAQPVPPKGSYYNENYGVDVATGVGRLSLRLDCRDKTHGNWYESAHNL